MVRNFMTFSRAIMVSLFAVGSAHAADFQTEIRPLLDTYCYRCHTATKKKGDIILDTYGSAEAAAKDFKVWDAVLENLRSGAMPPDDEEKQPTADEREKLVKWIQKDVFATDPNNPDPGRVTIRRLNRVEYNNTIRDLVGVDFEPADDFPADDSGYGFDNIGDVLSLPPVLFERYLAAAEKIMSAAILNDHKPRSEKIRVDLLTLKGGPEKGSTPVSRRIDESHATVSVELPVAGAYTFRIEAAGPRVGAEATKLEVKLNGQIINIPAMPVEPEMTAKHAIPVNVPAAGKHTLTFRVANPLPQPEMKNGKPVKRMVTLRKVELVSPPKPVTAPPTQIRLFAPGKGQRDLTVAARMIITNFASRAFRRPLSAAEVERFMFIYRTAGQKGGNFEQSVQTALTAILVSPHFLFRGELQPEPDNPKTTHPINEWALASRLSYFLWSTMPDGELFAQAQAGTLRKNLDAQVLRMIKDKRSEALINNFVGQWLQTRNLLTLQPDPKTFREWNRDLALSMERETELLIDHIMREDRPITDLLGADYTFVNERLARLYGIDGVEGDAFVKVKVPARRPGGILGHGSFLALTSNPTRTSPVKRGKFVLENILGTPPPPAPPNVPDLNDPKRPELKGTLRQKLEMHRKDALCAGCHARMDDIGFALENFDGIGQWRDNDSGAVIETAGQLVSGEKFASATELREVLLKQKRHEFLLCVSEKMLTFALGRGLEYYDRPTVERIAKNVEAGGAKFSTLVVEITKSVPFQMRRGEGDHRVFATAAKDPKPVPSTKSSESTKPAEAPPASKPAPKKKK
ncbi:MAG: hypothetical protein RL088_1143 [Verrucomicrobiota bacterium]|jgi:hypothetical protein